MDEQGHDYDAAAILTRDAIPSEIMISYNKNNPPMDIGTIYPTMEEFKMAVRQFATNKEFKMAVRQFAINKDIGVIASQVMIALGK